jgi:hypothetical protein
METGIIHIAALNILSLIILSIDPTHAMPPLAVAFKTKVGRG